MLLPRTIIIVAPPASFIVGDHPTQCHEAYDNTHKSGCINDVLLYFHWILFAVSGTILDGMVPQTTKKVVI